jgi:hypothetical protein
MDAISRRDAFYGAFGLTSAIVFVLNPAVSTAAGGILAQEASGSAKYGSVTKMEEYVIAIKNARREIQSNSDDARHKRKVNHSKW